MVGAENISTEVTAGFYITATAGFGLGRVGAAGSDILGGGASCFGGANFSYTSRSVWLP